MVHVHQEKPTRLCPVFWVTHWFVIIAELVTKGLVKTPCQRRVENVPHWPAATQLGPSLLDHTLREDTPPPARLANLSRASLRRLQNTEGRGTTRTSKEEITTSHTQNYESIFPQINILQVHKRVYLVLKAPTAALLSIIFQGGWFKSGTSRTQVERLLLCPACPSRIFR